MIKSMTGFSKFEAEQNGIKATVEIKSLNGRYLEISPRFPKILSHKEIEIRDIVKSVLFRGTVNISINLEYNEQQKPFMLDEQSFANCYDTLKTLNKKYKIKEPVNMSHVLTFASQFIPKEDSSVALS